MCGACILAGRCMQPWPCLLLLRTLVRGVRSAATMTMSLSGLLRRSYSAESPAEQGCNRWGRSKQKQEQSSQELFT